MAEEKKKEEATTKSASKADKKKRNQLNATAMYRALSDMSGLIHPGGQQVTLQISPISNNQIRMYFAPGSGDGYDGPVEMSREANLAYVDADSIEEALAQLLELQKEQIEEVRRQRMKEFDDVLSIHGGALRAARQRVSK